MGGGKPVCKAFILGLDTIISLGTVIGEGHDEGHDIVFYPLLC